MWEVGNGCRPEALISQKPAVALLPEPVRQGGGGGGPPDGVKLGPSPGRSGAQPCRPVWARLELCSVLRRAGSGKQAEDGSWPSADPRPSRCDRQQPGHGPCPQKTCRLADSLRGRRMNSQEGVCNPVHPSGPRSKVLWESSGRVAGGLCGVSRCSALLLGWSLTLTPATAIWAIVGTTGRGLSGQVSCAALSPLRNWESTD